MKHKHNHTAYILGMSPAGLGAARSLGRNGINIIALDYDSHLPGLKSKYCHSKLCPHPINEPENLASFMYKEGKKLDEKAVLFPTSDEFVVFVSRFREQLQPYYLYALPSSKTVENLLNKHSLYTMAEKLHIPHPKTFYSMSSSEIKKIAQGITYPTFIKPCLTYQWKLNGFVTKGFLVNNSKELYDILTKLLDKNIEVVAQSVIKGPPTNLYEVCCYCNTHKDKIISFVKRKLRQFPNDFGLGSYMESVIKEELIEISKQFLDKIKFVGPAEIEYKKDECDGQYKMIEVNVRLTLQNSLAEASGINFPLLQYYDLTRQDYQIEENYKEGITWVWEEIDFQSFLELRRKKELNLFKWLESIFSTNQYALFSWDDFKPFLKSINYGLNILKLPLIVLKK